MAPAGLLKKEQQGLHLTAWQQDIPLEILPLGINYSNFRKFGKNIFLNFGTTLTKEKINAYSNSGKIINEFNENLKQQLQNLVFEIDNDDKEKLKKIFNTSGPFTKKILLLIPAALGYILHFLLYFPIHLIIKNKAQDHYDSIMIGLLFFIYPLYVLLLTFILFFIIHTPFAFFLLPLIPLTALSLLHFKEYINNNSLK